MLAILQREWTYLWYYITVQLEQLAGYWALGILLGSLVSVFGKDRIHRFFTAIQRRRLGVFGIIPASLVGIASPLCLYGTIPVAASFSEKGMRDDWLAAFMMCSILLNPQLILYSAALGATALTVRVVSCFLCGVAAGLCIRFCFKGKPFFNFSGFTQPQSRDTDPSVPLRLLKNIGRNIRATGPWFLAGIALTALFQRYVPSQAVARLFGGSPGFGVLMAATLGVPLYACGGGTIPLLADWLRNGMSLGSAAAFMITGPSTKITNLGALKSVLGIRNFALYIVFVVAFALLTGVLITMV